MNLDTKRIIRRLKNGNNPSVFRVIDPIERKTLRILKLGGRPSSRSGNAEFNKEVRKILNRSVL